MAIDAGRAVNLFVVSNQTATVTVDLLQTRFFVASITINMIDSLIDFDRDNAVAADIFSVDGVRTAPLISGGDHWGGAGTFTNVHQASLVRFGRFVTFRLRGIGPDINACAQGVVVV